MTTLAWIILGTTVFLLISIWSGAFSKVDERGKTIMGGMGFILFVLTIVQQLMILEVL